MGSHINWTMVLVALSAALAAVGTAVILALVLIKLRKPASKAKAPPSQLSELPLATLRAALAEYARRTQGGPPAARNLDTMSFHSHSGSMRGSHLSGAIRGPLPNAHSYAMPRFSEEEHSVVIDLPNRLPDVGAACNYSDGRPEHHVAPGAGTLRPALYPHPEPALPVSQANAWVSAPLPCGRDHVSGPLGDRAPAIGSERSSSGFESRTAWAGGRSPSYHMQCGSGVWAQDYSASSSQDLRKGPSDAAFAPVRCDVDTWVPRTPPATACAVSEHPHRSRSLYGRKDSFQRSVASAASSGVHAVWDRPLPKQRFAACASGSLSGLNSLACLSTAHSTDAASPYMHCDETHEAALVYADVRGPAAGTGAYAHESASYGLSPGPAGAMIPQGALDSGQYASNLGTSLNTTETISEGTSTPFCERAAAVDTEASHLQSKMFCGFMSR